MKKYVKYIIITILFLFVWIGIDRYTNINHFHTENNISMITVNGSIWSHVPKTKYITLDTNKFKPISSFLYVEDFNPFIRTWNHTLGSRTEYSFKNENTEPRLFSIIESDKDFNHEYEFSNDLSTVEMVNGVKISHGNVLSTSYAIRFENQESIIIIQFERIDINELKPTLQNIYEQLTK